MLVMARHIALFGLLGLVAATPAAATSTISYTVSQPSLQGNFLGAFGVNLLDDPMTPFNPSLGQLTAITFAYNYDATIEFVAPINDPANGNGGASYYDPLGQYHYGSTGFDSGYLDVPATQTANGSSATVFDVTTTIDLHPSVTLTGAALSTYLSGLDTYNVFDVDMTPEYERGGTATGTESASMTVTYSYIPTAVPELPTWIAMIAGIGMIGTGLRRQTAVTL
jgi:hypothetical protein